MKNKKIFSILLFFNIVQFAYSQNDKDFLIQSFEYITYKTKDNYNMDTYVVMSFDDRIYVYTKYNKDVELIKQAMVFYELYKIDKKKYEFKIRCCGSLTDGSFYYNCKKNRFYALNYVMVDFDEF